MLFLLQNVTPHPRYKSFEKYHDIALIELETPVEFNRYIWPACLHSQNYKIGDTLTVAGFARNDLRDGKIVNNFFANFKTNNVL